MISVRTAGLGDLCEFIRNGMNIKQNRSGDGLPITRIETISDGKIDLTRVGYAGLNNGEASKWVLQEGDILFSHINSVEHIGKCALYEGSGQPLIHGMNLLCLRPRRERLNPKYAKWLLKSPEFRAKILPFINKAVNQASISTTNLKSIEVSIPHLDEQKRVAAILDKADELRRLRQRAIERVGQLGQSIFYEMFGDPTTNPKNLPRLPLGDIIRVSSGDGLTAEKMNGGKIPVYGGNGINGWHDEHNTERDTIVIGRVGVYCGAVHVTESSAWVTDNALIVTKKRQIDTSYLAAALRYANLNQYAGRSAQPLVSGTRIYPVVILVPSSELQQEFDRRISVCCNEGGRLVHALKQTDYLFASLQQRAFRGEL